MTRNKKPTDLSFDHAEMMIRVFLDELQFQPDSQPVIISLPLLVEIMEEKGFERALVKASILVVMHDPSFWGMMN